MYYCNIKIKLVLIAQNSIFSLYRNNLKNREYAKEAPKF
jgi:hypothetical protein